MGDEDTLYTITEADPRVKVEELLPKELSKYYLLDGEFYVNSPYETFAWMRDNEPIFWDIFPNQKYVSLIKGDNNTEDGDASASFQVTSQTSGKGFRFRISADVGDASLRSKMYVIEEIVTGAPPPVTDLVITPSGWSNDPSFKLDWNILTELNRASQCGLNGILHAIKSSFLPREKCV